MLGHFAVPVKNVSEKVQVGNDQEMTISEKIPTPKTEIGKTFEWI